MISLYVIEIIIFFLGKYELQNQFMSPLLVRHTPHLVLKFKVGISIYAEILNNLVVIHVNLKYMLKLEFLPYY